MTNTKKKVIIIPAVCAFIVIAFCLTVYAWTTNFDEDWVIGKSKEKIEQRYGAADIYQQNEYIEYWTKDDIGYKINRVFFDSNDVAKYIEYEYTNGDNTENNSNDLINLPTEMPKDFAIKFTSKYLAEEIYDTYTGTIQKALVEKGTATANFTPSEETLKDIYAKVLEYKICAIDRKMTNDVLADEDGLQFNVSFNYTYEIKITANGNTYIVRGDDTALGYTDTDIEAKNFMKFVSFMRTVLYENPEYQNTTFNFNTYEKMLSAFLTYDTTQSSYNIQDYKLILGDAYTNFLEKVETDRFIPQPMLDNTPIAYRNEDGFSSITFLTNESYNMPWIWYHCVTNGENVTVKITYPDCINNEIDYSKNCSEILKSIAPNAVNIDNYKEYSSYKNVYLKTISVTSGETSALIYEFNDSDNIIVMFCYNDILVSLNGKASVLNESFLEKFSMSIIQIQL